jgi:hypothetical protein
LHLKRAASGPTQAEAKGLSNVARRLVEPLGRPVHISAVTPVAETGTRTSCTEDQSWLIVQSRTDEVTDDEFDAH